MSLLLIRHATAGDRNAWVGDDRVRPVDERGRRQSDALVDVLAGYTIERIVSSPYLRCVQTVEPLARALGLPVEQTSELADEHQHDHGPSLLAALLSEDAVACVHGGIDEALGFDRRFRKGAVWIFRDDLRHPEVLVD